MGGGAKYFSGNVLLSRGKSPSTIGAGGLNGRVRDGNGCFPSAMVTGKLARLIIPSKLHRTGQMVVIVKPSTN